MCMPLLRCRIVLPQDLLMELWDKPLLKHIQTSSVIGPDIEHMRLYLMLFGNFCPSRDMRRMLLRYKGCSLMKGIWWPSMGHHLWRRAWSWSHL